MKELGVINSSRESQSQKRTKIHDLHAKSENLFAYPNAMQSNHLSLIFYMQLAHPLTKDDR